MTDWRTEVRVELARRNVKYRRLAEECGMTPTGVTYILSGRCLANPRFALACETYIGISAERILREEADTRARRKLGKQLDQLHAMRGE